MAIMSTTITHRRPGHLARKGGPVFRRTTRREGDDPSFHEHLDSRRGNGWYSLQYFIRREPALLPTMIRRYFDSFRAPGESPGAVEPQPAAD